ncbi:MAG: hypothetical protein E7667_03075 [Ruminococcaceae bacterium]|nr:hypothetical protein [Oscillospiraceae bacterium]
MKTKGLIIGTIVLLSIWSMIATMAAVGTEKKRVGLVEQKKELREEFDKEIESQEKAYNELEAKYAELEAEYEQEKNEHLEFTLKCTTLHLAYEWLVDVMANTSDAVNNVQYDPDAALDRICEREGLGLYSKLLILQKAQQILLEYGLEIK